MPGWEILRDRVRANPRTADAVLAGLVFAFALLMPGRDNHGFGGAVERPVIVLTALSCGMLLLRRSLPVQVWLVTVLIGVLGVLVSDGPPSSILPSFVALYGLAARRPLVLTAAVGLATAAAPLLASVAVDRWFGDLAYGVIGWSGMAAAVGAVVRSQRAILAAAEERAVRAEQTREEEAHRRVTEERMRIARDLHDVVAHHISVINVQSGVARHLMDGDPVRARASITVVREASQAVLSELSAILGLLRTTEGSTGTQPAPSLSQADSLVDSARHAGVHVTWHLTGEPIPLPPLIDLTAYRIVQESLTNVAKHGAGEADVGIEYTPTLIRITVSNPLPNAVPNVVPMTPMAGPGEDTLPTGLGVIGMIERARSVGGRIRIGPTPGRGYVVIAELPRELS